MTAPPAGKSKGPAAAAAAAAAAGAAMAAVRQCETGCGEWESRSIALAATEQGQTMAETASQWQCKRSEQGRRVRQAQGGAEGPRSVRTRRHTRSQHPSCAAMVASSCAPVVSCVCSAAGAIREEREERGVADRLGKAQPRSRRADTADAQRKRDPCIDAGATSSIKHTCIKNVYCMLLISWMHFKCIGMGDGGSYESTDRASQIAEKYR